jgi:hypothetical protein
VLQAHDSLADRGGSSSSSGEPVLSSWEQVVATFSNRLILYLMLLKALKVRHAGARATPCKSTRQGRLERLPAAVLYLTVHLTGCAVLLLAAHQWNVSLLLDGGLIAACCCLPFYHAGCCT